MGRAGPGLDARRGGVPATELALPEVLALLAAHRASYCVMSGAGLPCVLRATTDFVYVQTHGLDREHLSPGSYPDADLRWWATRIGEWDRAGQDVFVHGMVVPHLIATQRL